MAKITLVLEKRTQATSEFLLSLGVSPAIVDNVREVRVELEEPDIEVSAVDRLTADTPSKFDKINQIKESL